MKRVCFLLPSFFPPLLLSFCLLTNDYLSFSSGLSLNLIAGICAGVGVVLLLAAAVVGVIYFCCRSSNKGKYHLQITDTIVRGKHHLY